MMFNAKCRRTAGFTLIEILVALMISGIVMGGIYSAFKTQQDSYLAQEQVAEMQQNIRFAIDVLSRDLRMSGYDPSISGFGFVDNITNNQFDNGAGVTTPVSTTATQISFYADLDGDGTIDRAVQDIDGNGNIDISESEQISYRLNGTDLQRYSSTTGAGIWQTLADNIENIEFNYLDSAGASLGAITNLNAGNVRSVQISILAVARNPDRNYLHTQTYLTGAGVVWVPINDNLRRRFEVINVRCRNMGI